MDAAQSGPYVIIPDNGSAGGVVDGPGVSEWRPCRNVIDGFNRVTDAYAAGQESLRTRLADVERERDAEASINARWQEMNRNQVEQIRTLTRQVKVLREACMSAYSGYVNWHDGKPVEMVAKLESALTSEGAEG